MGFPCSTCLLSTPLVVGAFIKTTFIIIIKTFLLKCNTLQTLMNHIFLFLPLDDESKHKQITFITAFIALFESTQNPDTLDKPGKLTSDPMITPWLWWLVMSN